ncbi:alpha/beta hydrolase [Mycobacterium colombiense]|nr:alpha/beta hydrolase [Mycobacterium colombiense]
MSKNDRRDDVGAAAEKGTWMNALPLVLIPGLASDRRLWQPVLDRLSGIVDPKVLMSQRDSIAGMADDVLAAAPDRFYLAGISMGGYVALDAALRGTDRVAGLILVNTSARAASGGQKRRASGHIADVAAGRFDAVVDTIASFVADGNSEVAQVAAAMLRDEGPDGFVKQQQAVLSRLDRRSQLSRLRVPTLVISAECDAVTPPVLSRELVSLIPYAEFKSVGGCGHLATLEEPSAIAKLMRQWFAQRQQHPGIAAEGVRTGRI